MLKNLCVKLIIPSSSGTIPSTLVELSGSCRIPLKDLRLLYSILIINLSLLRLLDAYHVVGVN